MSLFSHTPRLLRLSFPLMIGWLSVTFTIFVDRFFLAQYSLEALGAAVNAGTIAWGFVYSFQILTEMAQVVAAQYKGSGKPERTKEPTWQMLYVTAASFLFFIPFSIFAPPLFFPPDSLQALYFRWIVLFGPSFGLIGATSAYFLGNGEGRIITWSAALGNATNLILDWVLIFGNWGFPALGVFGAALATGIGMTVQGSFLLFFFLRRTGTSPTAFHFRESCTLFRVGLPVSLSMCAELLGWGLFYSMMAEASALHLVITSICQSLLPLFATVGIALQKAIASLSGELIGAKRVGETSELLASGLLILASYSLLLTLTLALFPQLVELLFAVTDPLYQEALRLGLFLSCIYLFFGGIRNLLSGILSAAGDTFFLTIAGTFSVWFLLIAPVYTALQLGSITVTMAQTLLASYGLMIACLYWLRFRYGSWAASSSLIEEVNH